MHNLHPDVHEHGLFDDCPACDEIAENPFANADHDLLRRFVALATANPREIPEVYTDARAVKVVLDTLERAGRIAQDAPNLLETYLRDRWRIRCRIEG